MKRPLYLCTGTNTMHTGTSIFSSVLVGDSFPVSPSMRKSTTLPDFSFSANRYAARRINRKLPRHGA